MSLYQPATCPCFLLAGSKRMIMEMRKSSSAGDTRKKGNRTEGGQKMEIRQSSHAVVCLPAELLSQKNTEV